MSESTALEKSRGLQQVEQQIEQQLIALIAVPEIRQRFASVVLQQVRLSRALQECTPTSILAGIVRMAQLGLDPAIPNECWLVPFKGQASFVVGYGGLRKLVMQSPEVDDVFAAAVCEHDDYAPADNPISLPTHRRPGGFRSRGRAIGYYAAALLTIGHWRVVEMSRAEVHAHKQRYSRGADSTFWSEGAPDQEGLSNFDKMALKTVLRQLCSPRNFSLTPGLSEALAREEALYAGDARSVGDTRTALYAIGALPGPRPAVPRISAGDQAHPEPSTEAAAKAADDLFGAGAGDKMRAAAAAHRAQGINRINQTMAEHGLDDTVIDKYWMSQLKRFHLESAEAFTPTQLEGLHAEVRARLAKRAEHAAQEAHAPEEVTTEADTTDDLPEFGGMAAEESQQHEYANQQK